MRIRNVLSRLKHGLLLLLVLFAAYEGYALWRAETRTPAILGEWMTRPMPLRLTDLTKERLDWLLAVEDPAFFSHHGVDLTSLGQGMTTITQALVKFLYFDGFRPGFAKLEQSLIARFVLDRHLDKERQLRLFLNQAYFGTRDGREIRGFMDAAHTYFGKELDEISDDEYLALIAMLIGPNGLMPDRDVAASKERVARIRRLLNGTCRPDGVLDPWYRNCGA